MFCVTYCICYRATTDILFAVWTFEAVQSIPNLESKAVYPCISTRTCVFMVPVHCVIVCESRTSSGLYNVMFMSSVVMSVYDIILLDIVIL